MMDVAKEISNYEKSLLTSLKSFQESYRHLTDFTIICQNGTEFKSHKILLAARSKYFEALFRQEPEKSSVKLDFEDHVVEIVLQSLVRSDFNEFQVEELLQLLEVTDFLQMEDCILEIMNVISKKLSLENIYDVIEFSECFQSLSSNFGIQCSRFVKENILQFENLDKIPKTWLKALPLASSSCHIKDVHGRFLDFLQSEVKLAAILHLIDPEEPWQFSMESKRKICFGLYDMSLQEIYQNLDGGFNYNSFLKYNDNSYCPSRAYGLASSDSNTEMKETMNILKKKYFQPDDVLLESGPCSGCDGTTSHHSKHENSKISKECHRSVTCDVCEIYPVKGKRFKCVICDDYDLCESCMDKGIRTEPCQPDHQITRRYANGIVEHYKDTFGLELFLSKPFGKAQDVSRTANRLNWYIQGPFRKIGVKSRIWNGVQIVQGLKVELVDGTIKSVGMKIDDNKDIVDLEIPKGQHIKDVILRSGWYIDQIGFRTNENVQLGPVGGSGGSKQNLTATDSITKFVKQVYLHGIKGQTVESQNAPCIAKLRFYFAAIPNASKEDSETHDENNDESEDEDDDEGILAMLSNYYSDSESYEGSDSRSDSDSDSDSESE